MIRQVGDIDYTPDAKAGKNINLRVRRDGTVCVSASQTGSAHGCRCVCKGKGGMD